MRSNTALGSLSCFYQFGFFLMHKSTFRINRSVDSFLTEMQ